MAEQARTQAPDAGGRPGIQVSGRFEQGSPVLYVADPLANVELRLPLPIALQVAGLLSQQAAHLLMLLQTEATKQAAAKPRIHLPA